MTDNSYYPVAHALARALKEVGFPVGREELVERWGATVVAVTPTEATTIAALIEKTTPEKFETAASLHNALTAALRSR